MKYYIIIPTYNEEKFIALTLQSIVEQTVLPSKVVVVNDGSTDKTEEIIQSFCDNYSFFSLVNITSFKLTVSNNTISLLYCFKITLLLIFTNWFNQIISKLNFSSKEIGL